MNGSKSVGENSSFVVGLGSSVNLTIIFVCVVTRIKVQVTLKVCLKPPKPETWKGD